MKYGKLLAVFALVLLVLSLAMLPAVAQDEDPGYGIPEGYEVADGLDGSVTLTSGDDTIIITSADSYAAVLATQEFESDEDELRFFLDRSGYTTGNALDAVPTGASIGVGTSNSRRNQQGAAYLYDLGRERFAVISLHAGRGQVGAPVTDVETVVSEFVFLGSIVDIAIENSTGGNEDRAGLSYLVTAVQNADAAVLETLSGEGNYTVFAPSNQAFINLFAYLESEYDIDILDNENQALLTYVLLYHVVEGDTFAADVAAVSSGSVLSTLLDTAQDGIVVNVNSEGIVRLNGTVDFVANDIVASNGVIHIIDDVLLPQCAIDTLEGVGSCDPAPASTDG